MRITAQPRDGIRAPLPSLLVGLVLAQVAAVAEVERLRSQGELGHARALVAQPTTGAPLTQLGNHGPARAVAQQVRKLVHTRIVQEHLDANAAQVSISVLDDLLGSDPGDPGDPSHPGDPGDPGDRGR